MKNALLFSLLIVGLLATACNDDDDDHDHDHDHKVTIEFLEPTDEEVVAAPDDVHIHIRVSSEENVHDVEIELYPHDDDGDLIIKHEAHSHDTSYEYERDIDLSSYAAGTEFHLSVKVAKDHEGTEFEEEDIHFSIP